MASHSNYNNMYLLNRNNYHDVFLEANGEYKTINNTDNVKKPTYIQLKNNILKLPSVDSNGNFNCNLNSYLQNHIYQIKTPDDKIIITNYKNNVIDFVNEKDRVIKNGDFLILANCFCVFKVQITCVDKNIGDNITNDDKFCLKIDTVFTRLLCTEYCINKFTESKFKTDKYITIDENGNLQSAYYESQLIIINDNNKTSKDDLTYGEISLTVYGHKNICKLLFLPLIMPLHY